jgi:hypothetical protein
MRLEPLYRIRFSYPEGWGVALDGGWQQMFFIAEGRWARSPGASAALIFR